MTPGQKSHARARAYDVLAELLLHGPGRVDYAILGAIGAVDPQARDGDDLESQFVTAFDLGVPLHASSFLECDGHVGGPVTQAVTDEIFGSGFLPISDAVAACHLGVQLGHMAALCRTGQDERARAFALRHISSWLPSHLIALESLPVPFWIAVVHLALDTVTEHVAGFPRHETTEFEGLSARSARAPSHPLTTPDAGLRDIASFLASPAQCGLFITDAECHRISLSLDLPRGFGHRRQRLETLLRVAAEYDALPALCDALGHLVEHRRTRLRALDESHFDDGMLAHALWSRLDATQEMLATLRTGALDVAQNVEAG